MILQVEVPSQFMESWLYDWPTIQSVSGHYKTGETLPREFFDRLSKGRGKYFLNGLKSLS